jgi:hypothetical protein
MLHVTQNFVYLCFTCSTAEKIMLFQTDGNTVPAQDPTAGMTTTQAEAVWDDASDSELEAPNSKNGSYNTNYC